MNNVRKSNVRTIAAHAGAVHIGISGWRYAPWRGVFYPPGLVQRRELEFASRTVNSIEINGSFYASQTPQRYAAWHADTPRNFVFSVKAPRYITHIKRLHDIDTALANFFASGIFQLRHKLGPILWQFPPSFRFNADLFGKFLEKLPRNSEEGIECARHCAPQLRREGYLEAPAKQRLRHAVEIRNDSFACEEFASLLRRFNVALVVVDTAGKWPHIEEITSDFMYLRLHGDKTLYSSGYSPAALQRWQHRIEAWSRGGQPGDAHVISNRAPRARKTRDVYCYFDNDIKVRAPFDARALLQRLGLEDELEYQPGQEAA